VNRDTTKPAGDVADAKLVGDWFDLIETDLCTNVRGFNGQRNVRTGEG